MRRRGLLVFLSVVLALSLVIAGCAQPAPEEEVAPPPEEEVVPPPEEEEPPAPKVYKFGGLCPITGYLALWGLSELRCIEFGIEKINAAGGVRVGDEIYMLEMINEDFGSDPTKAVDSAYKLIFEDQVDIIYSSEDNAVAAILPLLEENEIMLAFIGTQAAFTGPDSPHVFRGLLPSAVGGAYGVWKYMVDNYPDVKTVFTINQDDVQGRVNGPVAGAMANYFGLEHVAPPEYFSSGTVDFTPIATKIISLQPDVLNISGTFDAWAGLLLEAVYEMGTPPWKIVISQFTSGAAIVWAGFEPELVEGLISWSHDYTSEFYSPRAREMAEEFINTYGGMDVWGMTFADVPFQIKSAIERAGSTDKDKIYEYLSSPGAKLDSMLWGETGFGGGDIWYYGYMDRLLKIPTPVAITRNGIDFTVALVPWDEYSQIWSYVTEEMLPGLAK